MHDARPHDHIDVPPGDPRHPNGDLETASIRLVGAQQWVATTPSRVVVDRFSWLQAVHWVHGAGVYEPSRNHGPRFGDTTVRLAQLLADLSPCRPSIEYLMRRLKAAERTVQYHLDMLREAGLLAYIEQGSRYAVEGSSRPARRASHFAWTVPVAFDVALGIRTIGEGPDRRAVGIAEERRSLIGELAAKAARKVRKPRRRGARCTPMVGGTTHCVSSTSEGDEKTTAVGRVEEKSIRETGTAKAADRNGPRRRTVLGQVVTAAMQAVGDKLARSAYRRVPWVRSATHDQLRWVLNDAAGQGWDEQRTVAWLAEIANQYTGAGLLWRPDRPHALIAHALRIEVEQQAADEQFAALAAAAIAPSDSAAWRACWEQLFQPATHLEDEPARTDEDRRLARAYAQGAYGARGGGLGEVIAHIRDYGVDDALDLYGTQLCAKAAHMDAIGAI